jgi:hypothetical protein
MNIKGSAGISQEFAAHARVLGFAFALWVDRPHTTHRTSDGRRPQLGRPWRVPLHGCLTDRVALSIGTARSVLTSRRTAYPRRAPRRVRGRRGQRAFVRVKIKGGRGAPLAVVSAARSP